MVICHPRLVQTGLDLIDFPTLVWFGNGVLCLSIDTNKSGTLGQWTWMQLGLIRWQQAGKLQTSQGDPRHRSSPSCDLTSHADQLCLLFLLHSACRCRRRCGSGTAHHRREPGTELPNSGRLASSPRISRISLDLGGAHRNLHLLLALPLAQASPLVLWRQWKSLPPKNGPRPRDIRDTWVPA